MKFKSYEDYVETVKAHFEGKKLTVPSELMILPKDIFDIFDGEINFGVADETPKTPCDGNCYCNTKCEKCNHL